MHAISFIQDLAVIMLVAGVVTILFHRFKQPVVLGYIVAGFIIGPHTPPFGLIHDEETIKTSEMGISVDTFRFFETDRNGTLPFGLSSRSGVHVSIYCAAFLR